jgi:prepilin-type N-terminal cleavage/methylation domain-containing protein
MVLRSGFTLVELLVTIGIIALLSTMAMVGVRYAQSRANVAKVLHDTDQIHKALSMLASDTGLWPGGQDVEEIAVANGNEICGDGCAISLSDPETGLAATDGNYNGWNGPYMAEVPLDPWDNEYFFDTDYRVDIDNNPCDGGTTCRDAVAIGSYGPDGQGNNLYNSDDIIKILLID